MHSRQCAGGSSRAPTITEKVGGFRSWRAARVAEAMRAGSKRAHHWRYSSSEKAGRMAR